MKKRNFILSTILVFFVIPISLKGQTPRFYEELYVNPILYQLNNSMIDNGEKYNDMKYVKELMQEGGINVGYRICHGFSVGLGMSLKNIKQRVIWYNRSLAHSDSLNGYSGTIGYTLPLYGIRLNAKYSYRKYYIEASLEANNKIGNTFFLRNDFRVFNLENNQIFVPEQIGFARAMPIGDYLIPEIVVGYEVFKGLYLRGGIKYKWYKNHEEITIHYENYHQVWPVYIPPRILNDVHVYDNYIIATFGLSYQFWHNLKKK